MIANVFWPYDFADLLPQSGPDVKMNLNHSPLTPNSALNLLLIR